jgi:hypothetical protein
MEEKTNSVCIANPFNNPECTSKYYYLFLKKYKTLNKLRNLINTYLKDVEYYCVDTFDIEEAEGLVPSYISNGINYSRFEYSKITGTLTHTIVKDFRLSTLQYWFRLGKNNVLLDAIYNDHIDDVEKLKELPFWPGIQNLFTPEERDYIGLVFFQSLEDKMNSNEK